MATDYHATRTEAQLAKRRYRSDYNRALRENPDYISNGLLQTMLRPEAELNCEVYEAHALRELAKKVAYETNSVSERRSRRRRLKNKLKKAGKVAMGVLMARGKPMSWEEQKAAAEKKAKKAALTTPWEAEQARVGQLMTSEEKAKLFVARVRGGATREDSPALVKLRMRQEATETRAIRQMSKSGDYQRMVALRHRDRLDPIEEEVLERLEAKFQGTIFATEKIQKFNQKERRKQERAERVERQNEQMARRRSEINFFSRRHGRFFFNLPYSGK